MSSRGVKAVFQPAQILLAALSGGWLRVPDGLVYRSGWNGYRLTGVASSAAGSVGAQIRGIID